MAPPSQARRIGEASRLPATIIMPQQNPARNERMRIVLQRVGRARVSVGEEGVGEIGPGLLVLLGIRQGDTIESARRLADRVVEMRIFRDEDDRMNRSV